MTEVNFCSACIHGKEEGDYREISLRNADEMLLLLEATIAWAQETKERITGLVRDLEAGESASVLDRVNNSFVQIDLGICSRGHSVLGTVFRGRSAQLLIPPWNPDKVECNVPIAISQSALPVGRGGCY